MCNNHHIRDGTVVYFIIRVISVMFIDITLKGGVE